jgi:diaminopimelate dehydrogenase
MVRQRLAIVGFGRLGYALARTMKGVPDVELAGVVRRPGAAERLPAPLLEIPVATHLRDLERVDVAMLCVPAVDASFVAREILQMRIPLVECASLPPSATRAHYEVIEAAAHNHRVAAIVGAGWDPGIYPLLQHGFEILVPKGANFTATRPGVSLHHSEAMREMPGVLDALVTEQRDADGRLTRYVYAELSKGADPAAVQAALDADPLFAGERSLLFPVESIATLEQEGRGVVFERRGTGHPGPHENLLFEARFDVPTFAARVMLDAARRLRQCRPGLHRYSLRTGGLP